MHERRRKKMRVSITEPWGASCHLGNPVSNGRAEARVAPRGEIAGLSRVGQEGQVGDPAR